METLLFTVWIFFWYRMYNIATVSYIFYKNIDTASYIFYEMHDIYE